MEYNLTNKIYYFYYKGLMLSMIKIAPLLPANLNTKTLKSISVKKLTFPSSLSFFFYSCLTHILSNRKEIPIGESLTDGFRVPKRYLSSFVIFFHFLQNYWYLILNLDDSAYSWCYWQTHGQDSLTFAWDILYKKCHLMISLSFQPVRF